MYPKAWFFTRAVVSTKCFYAGGNVMNEELQIDAILSTISPQIKLMNDLQPPSLRLIANMK